MVTYLSTTITNFLISKNIIQQSEGELYRYGVLTMIVNFVSILEILILGVITDTFIISVIYIVCFAILRSFTGGFHFDHYILCNISYGCIYLLSVYGYLHISNSEILLNIICTLCVLVIYIMSPIIHINKPLDEQKKKRNGIIANIIVITLFVLSFVGTRFGIIKYVLISTALLQIITKGGKDYIT